jgi:beta-glucosidase
VIFNGGDFADAMELVVNGNVTVRAVDRAAQEDSRRFTWSEGNGSVTIVGESVDYVRESNGDMALAIEYRIDQAPAGAVLLYADCGEGCEGTVDISSYLSDDVPGEWQRLDIKLSCLAAAGADMSRIVAPFGLRSRNPVSLSVSSVRVEANTGAAVCP